MITNLRPSPRAAWISILTVIALVTAVNLDKAFHIDDTAYLEIAQRIQANPLHSTSGMLNWRNVSEPIHQTNQPHLFFYILAGWMALFGASEIAVHSLVAIFSIGALAAFWFLAREIAPGKELWLVALLFIGPAFLPSQNVMVDVPLLFFILVCFDGLLVVTNGDDRGWMVAAVAAAGAILTKYVGLVLLPIMVVAAALRGRWRQLWVLSIPIAALAAWSLLNLWDYGGMHVLERSPEGSIVVRTLVRFPQLILCLGSVAPLALLITRRSFGSRRAFVGYALFCIAAGVLVAVAPRNAQISKDVSFPLATLSGVFLANGLWVLGGAVLLALGELRTRRTPQMAMLLAWIAGMLLFLAAFAPDMAVRHVLLIMPPLLLIMGRSFEFSLGSARSWGTLLASGVLAVLLAVSDWTYADVYRTHARLIREQLGPQSTVWYTGHWGWQWYAHRQQMEQYETGISALHAGDFLIQPHLVDQQELAPRDRDRLALVNSTTVRSTRWTVIRTMSMVPWGGFYSSTMTSLPWRFSNDALEQFDIFRVERE